MLEVYGYIYRITNIVLNKIYIGQTNRSFKQRYGGIRDVSINHIYKYSHNRLLKWDIETYNDDKYWIIEPEFDVSYSAEKLNEKEHSLFMRYVWDDMEKDGVIKRADLSIDYDLRIVT